MRTHPLRQRSTPAAAGMLALGIGVTTALFSAIDAVLLRPLPVADADRVIVAWAHHVERGYAHYPILESAYHIVRDEAGTLAEVAATDSWGWGERPGRLCGGDRHNLRSAGGRGWRS